MDFVALKYTAQKRAVAWLSRERREKSWCSSTFYFGAVSAWCLLLSGWSVPP